MRSRAIEQSGGPTPANRANMVIMNHLVGDAIDVDAVQNAILGQIELAESHAFAQGAQIMRERLIQLVKPFWTDSVADWPKMEEAMRSTPLEVNDEPGPCLSGQ